MDRQYIRDHDMIERYLSRSLTAEEEQEFEEAYLGDPDIMDELEAAERLRDGIKELGAAGRLERVRPRPQWQRVLASPRYAAAASLLLAVSLGFSTMLYRENRELREGGLSSTSTITRFVALDSVRGGNADTVREPAEDEWTVLLLDAGPTEYDTYRAVLTRRLGDRSEEIWRRADLAQELGGTILIGVPGRMLRPGSYEVILEGRMEDWPAERFDEITRTPLTVVARD
jgi:hypothetical protein